MNTGPSECIFFLVDPCHEAGTCASSHSMAGKVRLCPQTAAGQNFPQMNAFGKTPRRQCGKIWQGQDTGTGDKGGPCVLLVPRVSHLSGISCKTPFLVSTLMQIFKMCRSFSPSQVGKLFQGRITFLANHFLTKR